MEKEIGRTNVSAKQGGSYKTCSDRVLLPKGSSTIAMRPLAKVTRSYYVTCRHQWFAVSFCFLLFPQEAFEATQVRDLFCMVRSQGGQRCHNLRLHISTPCCLAARVPSRHRPSPVFRMGVQSPTNHFLSPRLLTHSTCHQRNNYRKYDSEERRSYDVNQESARTTVS